MQPARLREIERHARPGQKGFPEEAEPYRLLLVETTRALQAAIDRETLLRQRVASLERFVDRLEEQAEARGEGRSITSSVAAALRSKRERE